MEKEIGQRLKTLRKKLGWSQAQLAEWLGVSHRSYQSREQGQVFCPIPDLVKLATLFGVSLDYLITGEDGMRDEESERFLRYFSLADQRDKDMVLRILADALAERLEKS